MIKFDLYKIDLETGPLYTEIHFYSSEDLFCGFDEIFHVHFLKNKKKPKKRKKKTKKKINKFGITCTNKV